MTKLRTPRTFPAAMDLVVGVITYGEAARITGKSDRALRYWSDPESSALPPIDDALALDRAYCLAGGEGTPFLDAYAHQLDVARERDTACHRALAADTAAFARDAGEAIEATFIAIQSGSSPRDHHRAQVEVQEASTRLARIARRLTSFLPTGAGPCAGKAGGTQP